MKKGSVYGLIICLVLAVLLPGKAVATEVAFSDVKGHWAENQILRLATKGYVQGYTDKTFRPDKSMTRAEFICLLLNGQGLMPGKSTLTSFLDTENHWARDQIEEAVKRGILLPSEYPEGFKPDAAIKRSEVAAASIRSLGKEATVGEIPPFKDQHQVAQSIYQGFITRAYQEGLMQGFETGEFKPLDLFTRAQACTLLELYLDKLDASLTPGPNVKINPEKDNLKAIHIYDQSYALGTLPISLKINDREVGVSAISLVKDQLYLNYATRLPLNDTVDNLEIMLNNNQWKVKNLQVVEGNLVIVPASWRINTLTHDRQRFNTEFIDLYLGNSHSGSSLAEAELLEDPYALCLAGKVYYLDQEPVTIDLRDQFYRIKKVIAGTNAETHLELEATEPLVIKKPDKANISAIFVGHETLDLNKIHSINFLVEGDKFALSDANIDAAGNFTVNQKTYRPEQVLLLLNGVGYELNEVVKLRNSKLVFNCGAGGKKWAKVNYQYCDAEDVVLLIDNHVYPLDQVTVVKRNIIRVKGSQYELDASLKCRFKGRTYQIETIDYDPSLGITTIATSELTEGFLQPEEYVFYLNDALYEKGWPDDLEGYIEGNWRPFSYLNLSDPAHFSWNNTTHKLIGLRIKIDREPFKIVDTAWRGASQVFTLYLEKD